MKIPKEKGLLKSERLKAVYQGATILIISTIALFMIIGALTSVKPTFRLSSQAINNWTENMEGSTFLYLFGLENRMFEGAYPEDQEKINWSSILFETATNIRPDDSRSLLGRELPGFSFFDSKILVAGEGTDYTNLPIESSPPIEAIAEDKVAKVEEEEPELPKQPDNTEAGPTTDGKEVVFIYSTHNRESFLPHLPEATIADEAFHSEVNITQVNDRFEKALENNGIGAVADETDIYNNLVENSWEYWKSYEASRPVLQNAIQANKDLQYFFDFHRDAQGRDITTKTFNGEAYARLMFVIGGEHENFEKNYKLAKQLHDLLNKKYPGISRGVMTKQGAGTNGKFNQDLSERAILVEFGGVENNMTELYRTADVFADVFSEFYWDAEKVDGNPSGS
ncbi:stage II sporulation protein P [Salirhabdus euzebyi]|uniref:Stage II sporulation protein P n=1 Tax=Salirhabdus euzebyi TaxID=394506 RepID=A0A841Q7N3_9BACI|nr:stage II sporulation protein P [Salirhabdus euzebyi]MBB6454334.1 stage II sporulation protein P [Salirhabdus euzebyi]